jgi:hypothetical protein
LDDAFRISGPDEGLRVYVGVGDKALDGGLNLNERAT